MSEEENGAEEPPRSQPEEAPSEPDVSPEQQLLGIDRFAEIVLKAGRVIEAGAHPNADRLLVVQVDVGDEQPRQVVAGIRADWDPEDLVGRTVIVVANLKPATLRGVESQGMLLAVQGRDRVIPIGVEGDVAPGTRVT